MSGNYENRRSSDCSRSRSRSPIHLSLSHNNQQLLIQRNYNQLTSINDNNEHYFHHKRYNHYQSNYSNSNNRNDYHNMDDDRFNQTINLYSDQELELKYRWEKTVHVSNIPYDMKWTALKDLFLTSVGEVMYIEIFEQYGKSLGCGSIEFQTVEQAKHAVEKMHQFEYDGRKLTVILDNKGYQTRRAKYQTLEGRLFQKNNVLHHHCNLSNQFDYTSQNINSISCSSQITDLNCIGGTSLSNYSSLTDIPLHVLQRLDIEGPITNKIFIDNLYFKCNEEKMHKIFSLAGCIRTAKLNQAKEGQRGSMAAIECEYSSEAVQAILMFNQQQLYNKIMTVKIVLKDEEKDNEKLTKLPGCLKSIGTGLSIAENPLGTTNVNQLESLIPQINPINSNSTQKITPNISSEFYQTIYCFEDLSNELLLEIFDYLDGYAIFQAFSNLNDRFKQLLYSSCILYKIHIFLSENDEIMNKFKTFLFCSNDITYLDAHQWEQFILHYYTQLEKFYFTYYDRIDNDNQYEIYSGRRNQFSSTFWIERKWIFNVKIDNRDIEYIIYPYKKPWYDYVDHKNIEYSTAPTLTLAIDVNPLYFEILFERMKLVLTITQIYHLVIVEKHTPMRLLIQLLNILSDLISLKLRSLSSNETNDLTDDHQLFSIFSRRNESKITKVYIEEINDIEHFNCIVILCPLIKHFQVKCLNNMNVYLFLHTILKEINNNGHYYLHSLCFNIPAADDQTIKNIQQMIECEQLLFQFTIKRVIDNIYLKWA